MSEIFFHSKNPCGKAPYDCLSGNRKLPRKLATLFGQVKSEGAISTGHQPARARKFSIKIEGVELFRRQIETLTRLMLGKEQYARRLGVQIGKGCRILTIHFGSEPFLVKIGDNVTISHGVRFVNHDGAAWLARDARGRRFVYRPIEIGDNCFIGADSILMPGVRIGSNVIVAAGSVVTKSIPEGSVVGGNPVRFIAGYDDYIAKALRWRDESCFKAGVSYRERVLSGVDESFKPELAVPASTDHT